MEVLGTYNPVPQKPTGLADGEKAKPFKDIVLDRSRTKYWLGVGAQPTDSVWKLLAMVRLNSHFMLYALRHFFLRRLGRVLNESGKEVEKL